jgi:CRP-like cAMP-binding protein
MTRHASHELRQLNELPVFATLPKKALRLAGSLLTPVTFDDGDLLCEEGHYGRQAFIITSGTAVVSRDEEVLATVSAGDIVGELALLGNGLRTASVTAVEPLTALVMSAQEFNSVLALPGVKAEIERVAAERVDASRELVGV